MEGFTIKSFKEQIGAVGLGIVAAMNESDDKFGRGVGGGPVLSVSPRSNPIPNFANPVSYSSESEEYTCVISRLGNNMIEKREYFGSEKTIFMEKESSEFEPAEFLSSCYRCQKLLHGLDIFMYSGDKAFCSAECRYQQIMSDERKEKRKSRMNKKQTDYSTSPCSSQLQFFTGLAAA